MAQSTATTKSNFDFTKYNEITKPANSGLRIYLALQMLQEAETSLRRYKSPFAKEIVDLVDELTDLRNRIKLSVAKRANSGNTEAIDNQASMYNASASTDSTDNPSTPKVKVDYTKVEGDVAPAIIN
jgi:hypothetical protein